MSFMQDCVTRIGHFGKYQNILCLSAQILHKHCFQFVLGLTMVPRENKNNAYAGQTRSIMVFSEVAYCLIYDHASVSTLSFCCEMYSSRCE